MLDLNGVVSDLVADVESYLTPFGFWRGRHQLFDFAQDVNNGLFMIVKPRRQGALQLRKFGGEFLVLAQCLAHFNKGTHYENAHLGRAGAVQNIRGHDRTVFRKGIWPVLEVLAPLQGRNLRP
jgi:hypothetical protein